MKRLIKGILGHKFIIVIISTLLVVFGIYSYIVMPKQEMPEIKSVFAYVQVTAPGLSGNEINNRIAGQLEDIITEYPNVENYTTTSVDNACISIIEMNIGDSDSEDTLDKVKNDIMTAKLDESVTDIEFSGDFDTAEVIYAIYGNEITEYELKQVAGEFAEKLKKVKNVSKTTVDSAYSEEIVVEIDSSALGAFNMTIQDVYGIIYANGIEIPMGGAEIDGSDSSIRINANYTNIEEIENLVIYADMDNVVKVFDIASVEKRNSENRKIYNFNGEQAAFVEVFFKEAIDYTVLGDEIEEEAVTFSKVLPDGVSIVPMTFTPDLVQEQVDQVMMNLILCILIVIGVVLIGLGIRNSMAIAITIPVTALATVGVLFILGYQLQLISIAGMIVSIGILVDNSIVISEATQHNLDMGMKRKKACVKAVNDNYLPVLTSTLTTVVVFAALLFLPGISGEVAFTLPLTILTAIIISYIVSITLTPVLASLFFKKTRGGKRRAEKIGKKVEGVVRFVLKASIIPTVLAFILLGGLLYFILSDTEVDILPKTERSVAYINYEYKDTFDSKGTIDFAGEIEQVIKNQNDVLNYAWSQGGDLPKFYMSLNTINNLPNAGRFYIEFDCETTGLQERIDDLENDIDVLRDDGSILLNRLELSVYVNPVQIILMGDDYDSLISNSRMIYEDVENLESFKSGSLGLPDFKTDIRIDIDREKSTAAGLTLAEVEQQAAVAINGISGALFNDSGEILDIMVMSPLETKEEIESINIRQTSGGLIPLGDLADIYKEQNLEYIRLYNGNPSVVIEADTADGFSTFDLESDIREIIEKANGGITVEYKGDNEIVSEVLSGLLIALGVAVFLIYLIMYFQFNSLRQPLIVLTTIPLSFIGSLAAILIFKEKISITTLLGIASLVGIVVNNGILLVEYINVHRKEGNSVYDSCVTAVSRRLRPILLASTTTVLGVLPLALTGGDFFRPMAITFMGGMMISATLVLVIIPGLYYLTYRRKK